MSILTTMSELVKNVPDGNDLLMKVAGAAGGGIFASGFFLDLTWLGELGQFLAGLSALVTVLITAYNSYKNRAKVPRL